jgi:ABC-2 type transport system ATP-binding protein
MSLQAINITKLYGTQKALDNVSFEIKTGEIVGFLGPNGAGKSTMMKIITGFISKDSGNVIVNGIDIDKDIFLTKKQIGYLPEHNPLYLDMYVKEYLSFIAKIFYTKGDIKTKVNDIIELTGLSLEKNKQLKALSKGYRQRTGLAAALIHNPDVLILDEPTTGLDPNQIIEMRELISKVGKEKTVLLSTHIMQEVEAICDRVIILDKGIIVADNPVNKIKDLSSKKTDTIVVEFNLSTQEELLTKIKGVSKALKINETSWAIESVNEEDIRPEIFNFAVKNNLIVLSMQKKEKSIEDIFIELTNKKPE